MPGKHVRFARNNTVHTFAPPTLPPPPHLTHDSHSPASTNSLLTPPDHPTPLPSVNPHNKHLPPQVRRSHSTYHSSSPQLHPLLEELRNPELLYDVRLPPTKIGSKRRVITPEEFSDPATSPRTSSMTIIHKYLPWSIHVNPTGYSRSRGMHYVTVWDVLNAIHFSLRAKISQRDYEGLGNESRHQHRVKKAYEHRYGLHQRGSSGYQAEKMGGVRRVDFLVEYVKFMGLTLHNADKGEYTLHTDH
ncbi:hypothetical protein D9756_006854 [Leucocoprinus leucothites]|uniref:DUF6699 domain-containing protein n=1 Tax=Leucocoprinus leucothites TaxID=201217 RepID=A0A8H5G218_9AGAR|nr:hypothetical protein D9756_006854 [Leucoagaricus leucothites]